MLFIRRSSLPHADVEGTAEQEKCESSRNKFEWRHSVVWLQVRHDVVCLTSQTLSGGATDSMAVRSTLEPARWLENGQMRIGTLDVLQTNHIV
jgi:hypothetical protein